MKKHLLFVFILFCFIKTRSQNLVNDSLNGFNSKLTNELANANNLVGDEKNYFISEMQKQFIRDKFHIKTNSQKQNQSLFPMAGGNIDFELGNLSIWATATYSRVGFGSKVPNNLSAVYLNNSAKAIVIGSGTDAIGGFSLTSPLGGNFIAKLGDNTLVGSRAYSLINSITVTTTENLFKFAYANVFEQSTHQCQDNPYLAVRLLDSVGNVLFNYFAIAPENIMPGFICSGYNTATYGYTTSAGKNYYYNTTWQSRCVDLSPYIGRKITLEVTSSECSQTGHRGYSYFDATLSTCPSAGKPNILSIGTNTYSLNYDHININNLPCTTGSLTVSAPSWPTSVEWNGPPGSGITSYTNQSFTTNQWGLYTLSMASGTACPIVKTISITPSLPVTLTLTTPTITCYNWPTAISASGANQYLWSDGSSLNYINPTLTVSTTFSVIGTDTKTGCSSTASITINPLPIPTLSISGPAYSCTGTAVTLTASGASTYTWSSSWNTSTISLNSSTPGTGTFYVRGTGANGCWATSPTFTVNWESPLSISAYPSTLIACPNTNYTLAVFGGTNYLWSTGATTNYIVSAPLNTVYVVSSTNACGTSSSSVTMSTGTQPIVSITGPSTVCIGSYTVGCLGAQNYYWMGPSGNANTGAMAWITPSYTGNTTYTVIGTDVNGCKDTINYSVFAYPRPTFTVSPPSVCVGSSNTITVTGTATSYTWTPNLYWWGSPSGPSIPNTNSVVTTPTNIAYYTVAGTDINGCTTSTNLTFNSAATSLSITANTNTVCNSSWATLIVSGADTYTWSTGSNSPTITVTPTANTTYSVIGVNACGTFTNSIFITYNPITPMQAIINGTNSACSGANHTFTATGATTYTWNSTVPSNTYVVGIYTTTTLNLLGKDANGCLSSDSKTISPTIVPNATVTSSNYTLCSGQSISITANGATGYLWSTGATTNSITASPTIVTSYSVWGVDPNGCKSGATTFSISPIPIPTLGIIPSATIACNNTPVLFDASPSFTAYLWNTSATTSAITTPITAGNNSFTVTGTYWWGCTRTATISIPVYSNPISFTFPTLTLCEGSPPVRILKSPGGGTLTGAFVIDSVFTPLSSGNYVIGYSISNCQFSGASTINVLPQPVVSFSAASNTACLGASNINLTGSPSGGVFSGLNISGNQFQPLSAGQNCIFYNYTDGNGCENYDQQCFYVDLCLGINNISPENNLNIVPNPTSGEINILMEKNTENISLEIYNTLGQIILREKITDAKTKINLNEQANGVYFVKIIENGNPIYHSKIIKQ